MKEETVNNGNLDQQRPIAADVGEPGMDAAELQAMATLVRMAHRRSQALRPDLDEEWARIRSAHAPHGSAIKPNTLDTSDQDSSAHDAIGPKDSETGDESNVPRASNAAGSLPPSPRISSSRRFTAWHLTLAVLSGAAAMLALVFLLRGILFPQGEQDLAGLLALSYDESPQQLRLHEGDSAVAVEPALDSLSFRAPVTPQSVVVAQAQTVKPRPKRLSTPRGMDFKVILPDGSEVWLNAESTIEFPSTFMSGERRVRLEGEAYFKVTHDAAAPFVVTTRGMDVRVLGTEFNLKSYATTPTHVALVEGSVQVMRPGTDQPAATLEPGREAWFDGEGQVQVQEVDVYAVTQWVKGFFYFDNNSLLDVLRDLGRWYNLGVVFHNPQAMSCQVHFSALRTENIDLAIESLNRLRKFKVVLEGNNIVVY